MRVRTTPSSALASNGLTRAAARGCACLLLLMVSQFAYSQPGVEPSKKSSPAIRLPDGTYLIPGSSDKGERVELSAEEWRKLLDQLEQLKKQQGARKPVVPSECRLVARIEKRGEVNVVHIRAAYEFRTTQPNTLVSLGGRRALPSAAVLDGSKLPVLETAEDGLQVLVDSAGAHTLTLDLEAPIVSRGLKGETGFEIGLPRAAITRLALDAFPAGVKRVNLTTRTPDPVDPAKPGTTVREPGIEIKSLTGRTDGGRALGPVDSLEVTWDPPVQTAPVQDAVRTAEWDVVFRITESSLETTARLRLQGTNREWTFAVPSGAAVTVERSTPGAAASGTAAPETPPGVARVGNSKSLWKVDFASAAPSDWVFLIESRQVRAKSGDAKNRGPFPVGPFAALDVFRQTGTVKVITGPHTRLVVKHGASLRQAEPPTAEENETVAYYHLATGPVGSQTPTTPLLEVEARPLTGRVVIRPAYRLKLTEAGWRVAMDIRVTPVRSDIDQLALELPAGWPTPDPASPIVDAVQVQKADGPRFPAIVRLANGHRDPFEFTLTATLPVNDPVRGSASLLLPRFPQSPEGEVQVAVEVPAGNELRAAAHEWDTDRPSSWTTPLLPVAGPDGKAPKTITSVAARLEQGLSQLDLSWQPHRPELIAEITANVDVQDQHVVIEGDLKLRSPEGFARPVHCQGPEKVLAVPKRSPFVSSPLGAGEWDLTVPSPPAGKDGTTATVHFAYALPIPPRPTGADARLPRKIPIGLFWPTDATRMEATLRIWPSTTAGPVAMSVAAEGWRTLAPEAIADRPSLPALTLIGTGPRLDLVLNDQPTGESSLAAGQVDRAVIEVSGHEAGAPLHRRGLFRIRQWFAPTVDLEVPGLLPEAGWSAFVDRRQSSGAQLIEGGSVIRIPLPADAERGEFVVEVRYRSAGLRSPWEAVSFEPSRVRGAAYAGPTRWLIELPPDGTALLGEALARVEQRWHWGGGLPRPVATATSADLGRWVREGLDREPTTGIEERAMNSADAIVLRQEAPQSILVLRVPGIAFLAVCSLAAFTVGLLLTRLPGTIAGLVVLTLAGVIGACAVVFPQPASLAAAAAVPGLMVLAAVLMLQAALRTYHQRRLTHLPGFTRVRIDPQTGSMAAMVPPTPAPSARTGPSKASTGTAPAIAAEAAPASSPR